MAVVRKKQDDKYLKVLRELVSSGSGGSSSSGGNRQCFDCGQKGPTYVNMTIGSFVCTRCSGVLRGLTPPHRVKSISMATFTPDEIEFLKTHGNETCAKTWLGLWDPKRAVHQDQRELMIDKYERKRYFLEPASPLKSLPNAAKLTPSSNNSSATHSTNNNNLYNNGLTNGSIQAMNQKNTSLDNGFQNISLTPPSSRSNGNGNVNGYGPSAISRPNHQQPQQNGHHYDAFSNGINGLSSLTNGNSKLSFNGSAANSETSSCNSNGFTPESDFVADFSSATIFDATSTNSVASSGSGSSGTNGYAKIQPINAAAHMMNGNAGPLMNGNGNMQNGSSGGVGVGAGGGGGFATPTNGNSENFADFDHAPIFNAAGLPISNSKTSNSLSSSATFNSSSSLTASPPADRYAALKDLDEQLRESKAVAAAAAAAVATSVVDSFGGTQNNSNINPFKTVVNSHQTPQIANPFQANPSQQNPGTTNLFAGLPQNQQHNGLTNGFIGGIPVQQQLQQQQQQQQQQAFYNYANGFGAPQTTNIYSAGPNGCGFGFGSMQQPIANGGGAAFNNPFAATGTLNSNNPFL